MRAARTFTYLVPNWPPQGPPSLGIALESTDGIAPQRAAMGSLSGTMRRRRARMGSVLNVSALIPTGQVYAGYPVGTVSLSSDELGNPVPQDVNGNTLSYTNPQTGLTGTSAADTQPGLLDQAGALLSGTLAAGQSAASAAKYAVWGIAGLGLYMIYKEAQTPEGRRRFGNQVKNTATGAVRAGGAVAKAAIL